MQRTSKILVVFLGAAFVVSLLVQLMTSLLTAPQAAGSAVPAVRTVTRDDSAAVSADRARLRETARTDAVDAKVPVVTHHATAGKEPAVTTATVVHHNPARPAVQHPAVQHPAVSSGVYSPSMLAAIWEAEGGSPAAAAVAVCIAEHESGGNPSAISPTDDYGLWQIHDDPAALNPAVSAREAVIMSRDGSAWSPAWTTAGDCGV